VVTLAALYGAGGSVIGPRVAERLGVPLLDREVPEFVSERTGLSPEAVSAIDQEPRSTVERLASTLGRVSTMAGGTGGGVERLDLQERRLRSYIEERLARAAVTGAVAVGRGGMVVLRSVPWALHVFLGGPRDARVAQRMAIEGIDRATAEARRKAQDESRIGYVRRAYGVDGEDPRLYHVVLDSTALDVDTCVEIIVAASLHRARHPSAPQAPR
jgi:cytidylate kinase